MAEEVTRSLLAREHEVYKAYKTSWEFLKNSYYGGTAYRNGCYLEKHAYESPESFTRRKKITYFYNYCAPVVEILAAYATKQPPKRTYGNLTTNEPVPPRQPKTVFDSFWWNCDYEQSTFDQFMRDAIKFAGVYGRVSILIDKPKQTAVTKQQQLDDDIRPYLIMLTPTSIVDWTYERINGKPVLTYLKIRESPDTYKLWYQDKWELWTLKVPDDRRRKETPLLLDSGINPLGEIPLVNLYNKRTLDRMVGISDLEDIADINKNIYYLCSDANEIIENTAFPMLVLPDDGAGASEDEATEVGPKNIVTIDSDKPQAKPFWLEAPHTSLTEIREWVQQNAQEIVRLAKMSGMRNVETSKQPWSGVAIELQERQLFSALVEKTTAAEQVELDIFRLFAKWEGTEFTGDVVYPTDFAVRDLTIALQNAMNAQTANILSDTFDKELQKVIVDAAIKDLDENKRDTIRKEIDVAPVKSKRVEEVVKEIPPRDTTGGLVTEPPPNQTQPGQA